MCCVQSTRRKKLGVTQVWWYVTWRRLLTGSDYFRMVGFSDHTVIPTEAICRAIHSMISSVSRAYGRPVIQTQSNLPQRSFHNSAFFASTRTIYSVRSGSLVWFIILSVGCRRRILLVFLSVVTVVIIIIIVVLIFFFYLSQRPGMFSSGRASSLSVSRRLGSGLFGHPESCHDVNWNDWTLGPVVSFYSVIRTSDVYPNQTSPGDFTLLHTLPYTTPEASSFTYYENASYTYQTFYNA